MSVVKVYTPLGGDIISCGVGRLFVHSLYMSVLLVDSQETIEPFILIILLRYFSFFTMVTSTV